MRAGRRILASLLTVALLVLGPLGVQRRCAECPADCPMHAAAARPEPKQPGCHRAPAPEPLPPGAVCLRSACGHEAASTSALALAVPPARVRWPHVAPGRRLAPPAVAFASADRPAPPPHPPRSAHA